MLDGVQARLLLQAIGLCVIMFALTGLLRTANPVVVYTSGQVDYTGLLTDVAQWITRSPISFTLSLLNSLLSILFLIAGFRLLLGKGYLFPIMLGMLTR